MNKLLGAIGASLMLAVAWFFGAFFLLTILLVAVAGVVLLILLLIYVDITTSDFWQASLKLILLVAAVFLFIHLIGLF